MKILIVSATWMEIRLLADEFEFIGDVSRNLKKYRFGDSEIDILVSGIGTTFTAFNLTNTLLTNEYSMVLNVGIAGSFAKDLKIGQVVNVTSEEFADLGIEETNRFLTLFECGFISPGEYPFENGILKNFNYNSIAGLQQVRGITLNRSTGSQESGLKLITKFNPQVESMEGASVFYVCLQLHLAFLEIRAISNYVGQRDPSKWDIPLSLENLKISVLKVLDEIKIQ